MDKTFYIHKTSAYIFVVNMNNGDFTHITKKELSQMNETTLIELKKQSIMNNTQQQLDDFSLDQVKVLFLSIHASTSCNLKCRYCFRDFNNQSTNLTQEEVKFFLDNAIKKYKYLEKIIVDPSGSGEPLMNMELLEYIGAYCKEKSDELSREVLPMLVSNGLLLDEFDVSKLRESGIMFGCSIVWNKKEHDSNRLDVHHQDTYKKIMKNIKQIKDRSLLGAAVTLNSSNLDIISIYESLIDYFPTISVKPARNNTIHGINQLNIDKVLIAYSEFAEFLIKKSMKGDLRYIAAMLNGDDYFGKFLSRIILKQTVSTRCDAGFGRLSLSYDKKIYACPAAIGISELQIGSLNEGVDEKKQSSIYDLQTSRNKCTGCPAKFVCGGECLVNSYYNTGKIDELDNVMCKLKKHLYWQSHIVYAYLHENNPRLLNLLYEWSLEKANRFNLDHEINDILQKYPEYTFTSLKYLKDHRDPKYDQLKAHDQ